ncbi:hypothetical protein GCM10027598_07900 [Amycolatopsis oliviviridis]|uniref:Uncharacterized protein n=1 Tax=Amycolatopsis oliviviridis TaxID=1471590 RepID=A0ABQ3LNM4_9PSEU|nr:hypothetical protein [Amycolatopsis oliviviridis]GHH20893.1 hypothetical protein GCM10017790_41310 [Amycolatopsis oliviviridis]
MTTQAQFEGHPLWQVTDELQSHFEENESAISSGNGEIGEQIRYCLAFISPHKTLTDPAPYSMLALSNTQSFLSQTLQEVRNYVSNNNTAHLQNASSYLDQAVHSFSAWPVINAKGGAAALANRAFKEYRDSAEAAIARLLESNNEQSNRISEILNEANQERERLAEKLRSLSDQIDRTEQRIAQDETRLDTALVTNSEAFTNSQQRNKESFDAWLSKQGEELTERAQPHLSQVETLKTNAEGHLNEIEELHKSVEKASSKAAAAILAKDYGSYSTREWVSGVVAYAFGFAVLVGLGIYLVRTFGQVSSTFSPTWQYVILKLGITVTGAIAAGVAFQFGSHALTRASTNKRVQLELGTIGAFLSDVEDSSKVERAKLDFVDRMFGRTWEGGDQTDKSSQGANGVNTLDKMLELVTKIRGQ